MLQLSVMSNKITFWNLIRLLFSNNQKATNMDKGEIEVKFVDQKFDGTEGWIRRKDSDWIRLDFMLEYFLSSDVGITKKYKGQLNNRIKANSYNEELLSKFNRQTNNGNSFDFQKYKKWLSNRSEIEKARKLLD